MSHFDRLEQLLNEYDWKPNKHNNTTEMRKGQLSLSVGHTCHWNKPGKPFLPSQLMKKDPRIYEECKRLFPDFDFQMCVINKNFKSPPHKDINNTQKSLIIGLGDYNGGDLCIKDHLTGEVTEHCIWHSPMYFDGRNNLHWTNDFEGTRYAVILGNSKFTSHRASDAKEDPYVIAIPSYKRAECLKNKTLKTLKKQHIKKEKIFIFVADEEERDIYEKTLPPYYHKIVVAAPGLIPARNFITDYFPENQKIFNLDDDIEDFCELYVEGVKGVSFKEHPEAQKYVGAVWDKPKLEKFINMGFDECERVGANLWGIYCANNYYFMQKKVTYDLRHIIGSCWGCINKKIKLGIVEHDGPEDFERTILYYLRDGAVVRYNNITAKSNYWTEPGGLQARGDRIERSLMNCKLLVDAFPHLCRLREKKRTNPMGEIANITDIVLKYQDRKHKRENLENREFTEII